LGSESISLKILLFTGSFPPPMAGGSVEYVYNIISHLPPKSVVVHTGNEDILQAAIVDKGIRQRIIRSSFISSVIAGGPRHRLDKLIALRQYLLWPIIGLWIIIRERPQVVHLGEVNFAGIAAITARTLFGIPYMVYTYAEEITTLRSRWLHRWWLCLILRRADALVTVSDYTRSLLMECGVPEDRIYKVLPAVSSQKCDLATPEQISKIRAKYHLENRQVLLTVGRLVERKGHATVIEALQRIRKTHPDVCYVIVGVGPQEKSLRMRSGEAGLDAHVIFTGLVDDSELACLYEICDVFVMPHREIRDTAETEGCPTVFLEASAHGKPVVGGNAGGVTDAILDGRTGFIIDGTKAAVIADVVIQLLGNPLLACQVGAAGREYTSRMRPESNALAIWEISQRLAQNSEWKK